MHRLICLCSLLLAAAANLPALDYSVTPADDLEAALDVLTQGDTLTLMNGVYNDPPAFLIDNNHGIAGTPITVRGESRDGVIVRRIQIMRNYWTIENMTIDVNDGSYRGIIVEGHHSTIRDITIHDSLYNGIDIRDHDNVIENCEIYDMNGTDTHGISVDPGADDNIIRGCVIYDCSGDCIQFYNSGAQTRALNNTIEFCRLYTTQAGGSENAIDLKASNFSLIRNCVMWGFRDSPGSDGAAIVLHQNCDNVTIDNCLVLDSRHGLRAGSLCDNIVLQRTVFYDIYGTASNWSAIQIDGVTGMDVYNCTFDMDADNGTIRYEGSPSGIEIYNNIFCNSVLTGDNIDLDGGSALIDRNHFYNVNTQGTNATSGNPLFSDPAGHDYGLGGGSGAIDTGRDVSLPYRGAAPDRGAIESGNEDGDGMPDGWEEFYFGDTTWGDTDDFDDDGTDNLDEYLAGTDPAQSGGSSGTGPSPSSASSSSSGCRQGNGFGWGQLILLFAMMMARMGNPKSETRSPK
ncbi:right-handed parallel beta-helix repeat-containing protein [Planctomycetota bacterium]